MLSLGVLLLPNSCSSSSKPKEKAADTSATPVTPVVDDLYSDGTAAYGIEITESSNVGDQLYVQQNIASTWTFSARMASGIGTASITQINASPQPTSMSISGTTVTFTPTLTTDLNGQITVAAQGSDGSTNQKTFIWGNNGNLATTTTDTGIMGILTGILPSLLGGTAGGTTGGIGSILTTLLGGLTTNN